MRLIGHKLTEKPFQLLLKPLHLWTDASALKKKIIIEKIVMDNLPQIIYLFNLFVYGIHRMSVLQELEAHLFSSANQVLDTIHAKCDFQNLHNVIYSLLDVPKIQPVSEIVWEAYLGEWTQVIGNVISIGLIEQFGRQNKTEYRRIDEDTIEVINSQVRVCGEPNQVRGTGTIVRPGYLRIQFENQERTADYYVLSLGAVKNGQYEWAIVSDPLRLTLFVLARNRADFQSLYRHDVLKQLEILGFSYVWNCPIVSI
jgi:lipocalin